MNKNLIAFSLYLIFWISFLSITGTLTSGYHLSDDHEAITFRAYMDENGFVKTYEKAMREDLALRFRPFYYLHRITLIAVFGTNFFLWSIHHAVLAILTSFFLFLFIYKQGYRFSSSLIFPLIILIGAQSAIWWRLGPNETIGLFFYSLSLFLLVNSINTGEKYQKFFSVLCLLLSSLSKESFLILVPTYLIILIYLEYKSKPTVSVFRIIKRNILLMVITILFLASALYVIINVIGKNSDGYFNYESAINSYLSFIFTELGRNKYFKLIKIGFIFLGIIFVFAILKLDKIKGRLQFVFSGLKLDLFKGRIPSYIFIILIFLSIIIPQHILYHRSGLWERYLIPLTLGYAILIIFLAEEISKQSRLIYIVYVFLILLTIFKFFRSQTIPTATSFTQVGRNTTQFFSSIVTNTRKGDSILMIIDVISGYEWGFSSQSYLNSKERGHIKFYDYDITPGDESEAIFRRNFLNYFESQMVCEISAKYPCIAIIPFDEQHITEQKINKKSSIISLIDSLSQNTYNMDEFNNFIVFSRKR